MPLIITMGDQVFFSAGAQGPDVLSMMRSRLGVTGVALAPVGGLTGFSIRRDYGTVTSSFSNRAGDARKK